MVTVSAKLKKTVGKMKRAAESDVRVAVFIGDQNTEPSPQEKKWRVWMAVDKQDDWRRQLLFRTEKNSDIFTYCSEFFLKLVMLSFSFWKSRYRTVKQTRNHVLPLLTNKQNEHYNYTLCSSKYTTN